MKSYDRLLRAVLDLGQRTRGGGAVGTPTRQLRWPAAQLHPSPWRSGIAVGPPVFQHFIADEGGSVGAVKVAGAGVKTFVGGIAALAGE
jgi:hypothetical protein